MCTSSFHISCEMGIHFFHVDRWTENIQWLQCMQSLFAKWFKRCTWLLRVEFSFKMPKYLSFPKRYICIYQETFFEWWFSNEQCFLSFFLILLHLSLFKKCPRPSQCLSLFLFLLCNLSIGCLCILLVFLSVLFCVHNLYRVFCAST